MASDTSRALTRSELAVLASLLPNGPWAPSNEQIAERLAILGLITEDPMRLTPAGIELAERTLKEKGPIQSVSTMQ